MKFEVYPIVS